MYTSRAATAAAVRPCYYYVKLVRGVALYGAHQHHQKKREKGFVIAAALHKVAHTRRLGPYNTRQCRDA